MNNFNVQLKDLIHVERNLIPGDLCDHTLEVIELDAGQFEVVQISSLGGACWIANRLDELEAPRYFTSRNDLSKFKEGMMIE